MPRSNCGQQGSTCQLSRREVRVAKPDHLGSRPEDTLEFIHSMLGQLRVMAKAERFDTIAHFIEMAYIQVGDTRRGEEPARWDDLPRGFEQRNNVA
jgi:hypothetical protein